MNNRIFFYAIIASHYSAFKELFKTLRNNEVEIFLVLDAKLTEIFSMEVDNWRDLPLISLSKDELFNLKLNERDVIVVGNDSEPKVVEVLNYFHASNGKSIMMQDGWLMSQNILRPIYRTPNFTMKIRWWLHFLLVRYTSFGKHRFHNFLGQNANYFFVYSSFSCAQLVDAGIDKSKIMVTGSPKHHGLRNIEMPSGPEVWVLFSTISYDDLDRKAMRDTILYLSGLSGCSKLMVKLHPDEDFEKYKDLDNQKVSIVKTDFNAIISQYKVDFAFCFASTIVLDMLCLKIPVLQLAPGGMQDRYANYFTDLPMVTQFHEVPDVLANYSLEEVTRIGEKYLLDLSNQCDSVKNVVQEIMQLR